MTIQLKRRPEPNDNYIYKTFKLSEVDVAQAEAMFIEKYKDYLDKKPILTTTISHKTNNIVVESTIKDALFKTSQIGADPKLLPNELSNWETSIQTTNLFTFDVEDKTTNKPEHLTQTYNFKHVIKHVDIVQAEAEFVEKYGPLLDSNNLISRTLVDYGAKTITIEAYSNSPFHPVKEHNKGFIFDLPTAKGLNDFIKVFEPLGLTDDDFTLYPNSKKLVTTSNKLTKQIINDAKQVIELENRQEIFTKTYHFDESKKPSIQDLLNSQLNFITTNKLHEDDITCVVIDTNEESSYEYFNTITITGKQSSKHKTYSDDVAAIINSCIIVDRFDSLLESALEQGSDDNVIQRVISYQHPVVEDSLELFEDSVNVNSSLQSVTESASVESFLSTEFSNREDIAQALHNDLYPSPFVGETVEEQLAKPFETPPVEMGDKVCNDQVVTDFELQEITFGQPDKVNHETIHPTDLAKFKDGLYIKLTPGNTTNNRLIKVLELTEDDFYYTKDRSAIIVTSNHVTTDFIKDKIKQLGGHSKLVPPNEIRVFTYSNDNSLDVSDLTNVKVFFNDLIQRYSDKHDVKIKPIKFEVNIDTNSAYATVEITPNYLRQSTNVEAIIINTLYNALLLKEVTEGKTYT